MFNSYNALGSQPIADCITSQIYLNSMKRINQMLCLSEFAFFYHFATSTNATNFTPAGFAPSPMIATGNIGSKYAFTGESLNSNLNPCMFAYRDWNDIAWDHRVCGSTDNHLTRPNERIRAFAGEVIQSRILLNNMCCDTAQMNAMLPEMLNGVFNGLMRSLIKLLKDQLIMAIFAPVVEKNSGLITTKTFEDDTTEVDLTGTVSLAAVLSKLSTLIDSVSCAEEYYWLVPSDYYGVLNGLTPASACCSTLGLAKMDMNGVPRDMGFGLQFANMPLMKIFPLPKKYFPVNSGGKIVTALIPKGSVAWTLTAPELLNLPNTGGASQIDIMGLSQQMFESEASQTFGRSAVSMMLATPQPGLNYNGELAAFTTVVTGRLPASSSSNMYAVLVDATPAPAPAPVAFAAPAAEPISFADAPILAAIEEQTAQASAKKK